MSDTQLTDNLGKEVAYDLRQLYAVEIVGEHLKDVARARKKDDYSNYFKCLKDLWIVIRHKIKAKYKEEASTKYNELMAEAVAAANKYANSFTGSIKEPEGCAAIEACLNAVEEFLYEKVEEANLFGSNKKIPGL